jgi:hypothetical protein
VGPGGPTPPPAPVGSKTIPLQPQAGPKPTTPVARQTTRLVGGEAATQPLPKATVKLQRTQQVAGGPPTASISSAPIRTSTIDDEEETDNEAGLQPMSIVALVGAIAAVLIALMSWQKITAFSEKTIGQTGDVNAKDSDAIRMWESNSMDTWKLPSEYNPFHQKSAEEWMSKYSDIKKQLHDIPIRPEKP